MMKSLKNNQGFTLSEMIISLAVVSTLLTTLSVVFTGALRVTDEVNELGRIEAIAFELMSEISTDLHLARAVDITRDSSLEITTDNYTAEYSVDPEKNILMRRYEGEETSAEEVLAEGFYMGYDMELSWEETDAATDSDYALNLTLTLKETDGTPVFFEEYTVRPGYMTK